MKVYDLVIVGGGAGGLFAGVLAGKNNLKTLIIEKENKLGKKLLATGNGRCNIANVNLYNFCYNNMQYVESIFSYFANKQKLTNYALPILSELEKLGLSFYSDSEGRVYPVSNSSACVVSVLCNALSNNCVEIMLESTVKNITKSNNLFKVSVNNQIVTAKNVLLCCGGNATSLATNLGHSVSECSKSLVGFKTKEKLKLISGVRVSNATVKLKFESDVLKSGYSSLVKVSKNTYEEKGEIIFKDDGISGICVMNASSVVARTNLVPNLCLDLLPDMSEQKIAHKLSEFASVSKENMLNCLYGWFAKPLSLYLFKFNTAEKIAKQIKNFKLTIQDTYDNNQVTCGGVQVEQLNLTLSNIVDNLYLSGEMLNIDGVCGGYNLMFALTSAGVCVKQILEKGNF